jgi:peptidoglycan/LPS O-acetylase OafA/YrhL
MTAATPTLSQTGHSTRIIELDGLRAFAILPVMILHLAPTQGLLGALYPVTRYGWMGVDLFFVLSGFLITSILIESVNKPRYYRNFITRCEAVTNSGL